MALPARHRRLGALLQRRSIGTAGRPTADGVRALPEPAPGRLRKAEAPSSSRAGRRGSLEDLVPGREIRNAAGTHWRHERRLEATPAVRRAESALRGALDDPGEAASLAVLDGTGPSGALFLDLETCGFAGTPLFLVGAAWIERGSPRCVQLLARDYAEEASVVLAGLQLLSARPLLVTFNGKSYDLPFLRDRAARHGFSPAGPAGHLDLLHAARRKWKHRLPDCRLQTLERAVTGRYRGADVPGSEAPERYHRFVKQGRVAELIPVLRHILLDLVTLIELTGALDGETGVWRSCP